MSTAESAAQNLDQLLHPFICQPNIKQHHLWAWKILLPLTHNMLSTQSCHDLFKTINEHGDKQITLACGQHLFFL